MSKVANRIAKKFPKETRGVYIIDSENKRIKALKWLKIVDVWGIGNRYARRLKYRSIYTAFDFINLPDTWVRKEMSVVGLRLKHELGGKPTLKLDKIKSKKAIATTRSFDYMYSDYDTIKERVSTFAVSCAEKLRKQNSCCNMILVFLHTNGYRKDLPQYKKNIIVQTYFPTKSSIDIIKLAVSGLDKIFKKGYQYKKAGVIVMGITPENEKQLSMFSEENPKHLSLMKVIDSLNYEIGQNKVKFGSQSLGRQWKMRQEKLSPRYTTKLDEIINIY